MGAYDLDILTPRALQRNAFGYYFRGLKLPYRFHPKPKQKPPAFAAF